jgi:hypothetical protein
VYRELEVDVEETHMFSAFRAGRGFVSDSAFVLLNHAPQSSIHEHGSAAEAVTYLHATHDVGRDSIQMVMSTDSTRTVTESARRLCESEVVRSTPGRRFHESAASTTSAAVLLDGKRADTEIVVFVNYDPKFSPFYPEFTYVIVRCGREMLRGSLTVPPSARPKSARARSRCGVACSLVAAIALAPAAAATAIRVPDLATYNALQHSAPRWIAGKDRKTRSIDAELVVEAYRRIQSLELDIRGPASRTECVSRSVHTDRSDSEGRDDVDGVRGRSGGDQPGTDGGPAAALE